MKYLNIPGLEEALSLAFAFTNFAAFVSIATTGPINYSPRAVRAGRFVIETDARWGSTLTEFETFVATLQPKGARIGVRKVVAFYRGDTQVMTIVEDPAP